MAALLGGSSREGDAAALEVAERYGAVVAVRGTVAAPDGRLWHDEAGGIGLGTSGSGDVLAGVVGGLLARGCPPEQAAVWGQYLHAAAGTGSPRASAGSASWPASCWTSCPRCCRASRPDRAPVAGRAGPSRRDQ